MQEKMWGNEYRTTIVCVDSYDTKIPAGRIYNPCISDGVSFRGVMEFLVQMEHLLDRMKFPQPYETSRTFRATPQPDMAATLGTPSMGKCATFAVRVLFRQNASWQGSVTWVEKGRSESFRSVLELLMLMHSVFADKQTESDSAAPACESKH